MGAVRLLWREQGSACLPMKWSLVLPLIMIVQLYNSGSAYHEICIPILYHLPVHVQHDHSCPLDALSALQSPRGSTTFCRPSALTVLPHSGHCCCASSSRAKGSMFAGQRHAGHSVQSPHQHALACMQGASILATARPSLTMLTFRHASLLN